MEFVAQVKSLFDTAFGLPLHPLVVHVAVMALPSVAVVAIYAVAKNRRVWWPRLLVAAFFTTGIVFVAKESGEALASRIGYT